MSGPGHAAIAWCSAAGSGRAQQCWGIRPVIARGMARPVACCIFADASLPGSGGHVPVVGEEFVTFLRGLAGADGRLPRWTDCGTNTTSHRCSRTRRPVGQSPASSPGCRWNTSWSRYQCPPDRTPIAAPTRCSAPRTKTRRPRPASAAGPSGQCPASTCTRSSTPTAWPTPCWPSQISHHHDRARRPAFERPRPPALAHQLRVCCQVPAG